MIGLVVAAGAPPFHCLPQPAQMRRPHDGAEVLVEPGVPFLPGQTKEQQFVAEGLKLLCGMRLYRSAPRALAARHLVRTVYEQVKARKRAGATHFRRRAA